jgi:hypothetical protein
MLWMPAFAAKAIKLKHGVVLRWARAYFGCASLFLLLLGVLAVSGGGRTGMLLCPFGSITGMLLCPFGSITGMLLLPWPGELPVAGGCVGWFGGAFWF